MRVLLTTDPSVRSCLGHPPNRSGHPAQRSLSLLFLGCLIFVSPMEPNPTESRLKIILPRHVLAFPRSFVLVTVKVLSTNRIVLAKRALSSPDDVVGAPRGGAFLFTNGASSCDTFGGERKTRDHPKGLPLAVLECRVTFWLKGSSIWATLDLDCPL